MSGEGFPWAKVISYFLWILGLAVILVDLSYHEFLVHRRKLKWREILERSSFLRPIHVGGTLILAGLAGSIQNPFLAGLMGVAAFLLFILFGKDKRIMRKIRRKLR